MRFTWWCLLIRNVILTCGRTCEVKPKLGRKLLRYIRRRLLTFKLREGRLRREHFEGIKLLGSQQTEFNWRKWLPKSLKIYYVNSINFLKLMDRGSQTSTK
ncbi:MAG: hypothetical protein ACTS4T_01540 [Candidatus Hodgkinia cicadicola]